MHTNGSIMLINNIKRKHIFLHSQVFFSILWILISFPGSVIIICIYNGSYTYIMSAVFEWQNNNRGESGLTRHLPETADNEKKAVILL